MSLRHLNPNIFQRKLWNMVYSLLFLNLGIITWNLEEKLQPSLSFILPQYNKSSFPEFICSVYFFFFFFCLLPFFLAFDHLQSWVARVSHLDPWYNSSSWNLQPKSRCPAHPLCYVFNALRLGGQRWTRIRFSPSAESCDVPAVAVPLLLRMMTMTVMII